MIHYKRKLVEGQLYKYSASTQWQKMARRSTQTPETWSIIKESWPQASFTNTRRAPNDKRWRDEVHKHRKHDSWQKTAGRRPALQIQGKHPMTRDGRTKYTNTRNMIHYKTKLAEGQLYKYKASTQWQEMARRSTQTPETWFTRPALQIQGIATSWSEMPQTKYANTRNMIPYTREH